MNLYSLLCQIITVPFCVFLRHSENCIFSDTVLTVSRREFFELWRTYSKNGRNRQLLEHFKGTLNHSISKEEEELILREILKLSKVFERKWEQSLRKRSLFLTQHETWLDDIGFQISLSGISMENFSQASSSSSRVGRPKLENLDEVSNK